MTHNSKSQYDGDPNMLLDLSKVTFPLGRNETIQDCLIQGRRRSNSCNLLYLGNLLQCTKIELSRVSGIGIKSLRAIDKFLDNLKEQTGRKYQLSDYSTQIAPREYYIRDIKPSAEDIKTLYNLSENTITISEPITLTDFPLFFSESDFIFLYRKIEVTFRDGQNHEQALVQLNVPLPEAFTQIINNSPKHIENRVQGSFEHYTDASKAKLSHDNTRVNLTYIGIGTAFNIIASQNTIAECAKAANEIKRIAFFVSSLEPRSHKIQSPKPKR